MEEEKAAAYYDELTRKGEGAAKFKQGLGFSSSSSSAASDAFAKKPSPFSLSSFVRASGNKDGDSSEKISAFSSSSSSVLPGRDDRGDRARVLGSIQDKLGSRRRSPEGDRERRRERREGRERDEARYSSKRSRESRDRDGDRERRRRRSRSRSYSPPRVSRSRDRDRDRDRDRERDRKRDKDRSSKEIKSDRVVDYSQLIEGYSQMTPAERVKAKMKLQLSQTAAKDSIMGMSSGWERFDFNKDAPLDDDDEETEVAEDISSIKNIGRSFRYSAVEARREEEIKAAHDQAMFGAAAASSPVKLTRDTVGSAEESENGTAVGNNGKNDLTTTPLLSDKVLSMQKGSWRDRARRLQNESEKS